MAKKKGFPNLDQLEFGWLDAKEESERSPNLLLNGYYDLGEAAFRISSGEGWILIGAKGSGKTASFEHLSLKWHDRHDKFFEVWDLSGFPVEDVREVQVGSRPGPSSTRAAWEFILLLRVFSSLMRDQGASYSGEIFAFSKTLQKQGLLAHDGIKTQIHEWSSVGFSFNVKLFGATVARSSSSVTALQLMENIKNAIKGVRSENSHVLAIDGLDSFFLQKESTNESLGALLDGTASVNAFLRATGLRAHVVLAIRHDMFARVPSTDSAKLNDHAIELDWGRRGEAHTSELWSMISRKVRLSIPETFAGDKFSDIRTAYLGRPVRIGRYDRIESYFVSNTRMLPRDLVALLLQLQKIHPGNHQVSEVTAKRAVRAYSENYFVPEIVNNLSRVVEAVDGAGIANFVDALQVMPSREFMVGDLESEIDGALDRAQLRALLKQMFEIGALGTRATGVTGANTNFKYRRAEGGGFSINHTFVLHNALVEAWNINR